jgi:hypothetical protein
VDLARCPRCTRAEFDEVEEEMPKTTKHGGASNATGATVWVYEAPRTEMPDKPVSETGPKVEVFGEDAGQQPEDKTGADFYAEFSKLELQEELAKRKLNISGNKPELIDRLVANDESKADQEAEADADG